MLTNNVINFKLKKVIKELESIEHLDPRLSQAINHIATISKTFTVNDSDDRQLNFFAELVVNDSKQAKL